MNSHLRERIVLDIETVAAPACAEFLDPITAPANYKDPLKIAAYCAEKRDHQVERAALEADLCEIVAVGVQLPDGSRVALTREDESERALISLAWDWISGRSVLGFNVLAFDLPVLVRRSQLLGERMLQVNLDRYRTPHVDLLEELTFRGRLTMRSLAFYCRRFGIPCDDVVTGADIAGLVAEEEWGQIRTHVLADITKTAALAERLGYALTSAEIAEVVL